MRKELRINSKLTFPNPYVVRVRCSDTYSAYNEDPCINFIQVRTRARQMFTGASWAYSNPEYEHINVSPSDNAHIQKLGSGFGVILHSPSIKVESISYWAFKDEQDALQFQLLYGQAAKQVHMWPEKTRFTVTDYIDE